ncbi:hypothetical protein TTHERM_000243821 (macronuclear) [Tetrahymena thermophila SB210]|uniref:Uncharacterized protein n=1 Tax=Tetrahymena thermophila (strain SB210) TaxID=312017 RepID=W7XGK6_TETTS|nr:hypothetical protein TTHERM_000243821 [Tetrahymena thermophila SB210]EWS72059.1 hypothetical protein TTHERM_000243821 [Tetrahymena thermophila SB210]|eukprot:XP_012655370.1 hypothetical protein TTHERM_000243821 [Tetrahymena thermophila SB210]
MKLIEISSFQFFRQKRKKVSKVNCKQEIKQQLIQNYVLTKVRQLSFKQVIPFTTILKLEEEKRFSIELRIVVLAKEAYILISNYQLKCTICCQEKVLDLQSKQVTWQSESKKLQFSRQVQLLPIIIYPFLSHIIQELSINKQLLGQQLKQLVNEAPLQVKHDLLQDIHSLSLFIQKYLMTIQQSINLLSVKLNSKAFQIKKFFKYKQFNSKIFFFKFQKQYLFLTQYLFPTTQIIISIKSICQTYYNNKSCLKQLIKQFYLKQLGNFYFNINKLLFKELFITSSKTNSILLKII